MAKPLRLTNEDVERFINEINQKLKALKCFGSVKVELDFKKDDRKAKIYFTPDAWNKINSLVKCFDTEVQWHGLIERRSENEFEVYDILVPPHVVTGSTVTSDQEKYTEWINNLDDETFNAMNFHGHSHVNVGVTPSSVDMKYREDMITQLPVPRNGDDDSFYIFMIFNKKGDWSGEIYDLKYNALYSSSDIDIDVWTEDGTLLSDFISDARKMAVRETHTYTGTKQSGKSTDTKPKSKSEKKIDDFSDYSGYYKDYYKSMYGKNSELYDPFYAREW